MAKKNIIGAWAFLIGVVLAVVIGLAGIVGDAGLYSSGEGLIIAILVLLGVIIGLLNVAGPETKDFMLAGAILVVVSSLGGNILGSIAYLSGVINALVILFVPATIVVALKSVFSIGRR